MVYEKLHDSSYPSTEHLGRLFKDVEACNENYKNVIVGYQKSIGVTPSDIRYYYKGFNNYYKRYKKAFEGIIENSDSDSSDEDEYEEDFIDDRDVEDVDYEIENDDDEDEEEDSYDDN